MKNSSSSLQASFDWTFTCSYAKIKIVSAVYVMNKYEYIDTWNLYILYIYTYWLRTCRIRRYTSCNSKGLLLRLASKLGSPCCLQPLFLLTSHSHLSQSLLKRQNPREPKWDPHICFVFVCVVLFMFYIVLHTFHLINLMIWPARKASLGIRFPMVSYQMLTK